MGFYLWTDDELAWAQGTYEYRPMGTAVIALSDQFRRRDFDPRRKLPRPAEARFAGQFASLGHLNGELRKLRRVPARQGGRSGRSREQVFQKGRSVAAVAREAGSLAGSRLPGTNARNKFGRP
jgi:hypothetical protein